MPSMAVSGYQNVNWSNVSTFGDVLQRVNESGAGYLFTTINFLVFFVLLITLSASFGWEVGMLASAFIGISLGLLFSYMGVMSWQWTMFFAGLIIVYIMYSVWNRND